MHDIVKVKSGSKYEELFSYSRLVVAGDFIFVSNTAGRDYGTGALPNDARRQAEQCVRNIQAALGAVGASLANVVATKVYVPDAADLPQVAEILGAAFKGIDPASTITCTPLGETELKVEMEVTAYSKRGETPTERRLQIDLSARA
jgi:2-iminobutanoate/2-iminopropanoate deaminase